MDEDRLIAVPDAHQMRLISVPDSAPEDFVEYAQGKMPLIREAAQRGDAEIELSCKPEFAKDFIRLLASAGYSCFCPRRGKVSVTWVNS